VVEGLQDYCAEDGVVSTTEVCTTFFLDLLMLEVVKANQNLQPKPCFLLSMILKFETSLKVNVITPSYLD
jgi:hypothetical protein